MAAAHRVLEVHPRPHCPAPPSLARYRVYFLKYVSRGPHAHGVAPFYSTAPRFIVWAMAFSRGPRGVARRARGASLAPVSRPRPACLCLQVKKREALLLGSIRNMRDTRETSIEHPLTIRNRERET